jgi:hypothetical protein
MPMAQYFEQFILTKVEVKVTPATNEYQALQRLRSCKNSSTIQSKEVSWLRPSDPRLVHVRCGGKSDTETGSSPRTLGLFPVSITSPMLHIHFYPNANLTARTNCVKAKQFRYRPGVAQKVPES